jgi:hypothetical protein
MAKEEQESQLSARMGNLLGVTITSPDGNPTKLVNIVPPRQITPNTPENKSESK